MVLSVRLWIGPLRPRDHIGDGPRGKNDLANEKQAKRPLRPRQVLAKGLPLPKAMSGGTPL
ncbi:hypothetical protein WG901_08790 [Novosphingobium sp. PS1R-30]|uniref:Uncharacterized protein n=1 Tax=Novosphingobium anseongense TaxID=3133436 RepID=A0ABU8RUI2_9SPHN